MKFTFKKIASVLASAVMLSSTVALAAAATYPAPFVANGAADVAIVYGSNAANTDLVAALDITSDLQAELAKQTATTTTTGASASGGDSVKIETGSNKLNIGENLTDVKTTNIEASDMPTMLKKGTFQAKDGSSYDYEQYFKLGSGMGYNLFADLDYNNRVPTLGIKMSSGSAIANYTLSFAKSVMSSVSAAGRLTDLENTDITILGKSYKLLNAYNATNLKLELMGGAVSDTLMMDESKDYTVGGKTYTVKVIYVDATQAKLSVNGVETNKMIVGGTQKLADGTQVGIRDVLYQNFAGGVMKAEFSLGAEKLTLESGQKLKLNDNNINDVVVSINKATASSSKEGMDKIILSWIVNDKTFITESKSASFPGLNSITFKIANFTVPKTEEVLVTNSGDKTLQIKLPLKSGTATIPILSLNSAGTGITRIGGDTTGSNLVTSNSSVVSFNRTTDQYFVATYRAANDGESYLLKVSSITKDSPTTGTNITSITNQVTGETVCLDKKAADTCTIGNVVLTITSIDPASNGLVTITGGSNVNFNTIITPAGLLVNLPTNSSTMNTSKTYINLTATTPAVWEMTLEEADKNKAIAAGNDITFVVGITSTKIEVQSLNNTGFSGGDKFDLGGSSTISKYQAYLGGEMGTELIYDTKPDQNTLTVNYRGGESFGNVFITAPETSITSGASGSSGSVATLGSVAVADAEAASVATKNIIVVGGSCINSVAADLLGGALCGADFEAKTGVGAGSYLIQTFSRTGGKVATLVAGYNAADTTNAAKFLTTNVVDTSADKKYKDGVVTVVTTAA